MSLERVAASGALGRPRWNSLGNLSAFLIYAVVGGIILYLAVNTQRNLAARGIVTGFAFLDHVSRVPISESLIPIAPGVDSYARALLVGVLNTLKVSLAAIVLATLVGLAAGLGSLSRNLMLRGLCRTYVGLLRNVPILVQLIFWYELCGHLPGPRQAWSPVAGIYLTNRGLRLPWLADVGGGDLAAAICGVVLLGASLGLGARGESARTRGLQAMLAVAGIAVLAIGFGWSGAHLDMPVLRGFDFRGGVLVSIEFVALLTGLVTYTGAFIAEIVRGAVLAVPPGQWEAGRALGLRPLQIVRRIVLPQAARTAIPPLTSEYLGLIKNSSLAVAIGYQDIVSISNSILSETGQAVEGVAIIMAVFLTISLSVSLLMRWFDARFRIVER